MQAKRPEVESHFTDNQTSHAMNSVHALPPPLPRQDELSKQLLTLLRSMAYTNVDISHIERRLGFEWKSFLFQDPNVSVPFNLHDDPFFADMIHARTAESVETFLYTLPYTLASLTGLHPSQSIHVANSQINTVRNLLSSKLVPVCTVHSTTPFLHKTAHTLQSQPFVPQPAHF